MNLPIPVYELTVQQKRVLVAALDGPLQRQRRGWLAIDGALYNEMTVRNLMRAGLLVGLATAYGVIDRARLTDLGKWKAQTIASPQQQQIAARVA